jgi:NADP-dependent 3-hydroxy acid dehydrogenase YdfG
MPVIMMPQKTNHCPCDVADRAAVHAAFAQVREGLGPVDILINAAGCMYFTLMKNEHFGEWEQMIDVNAKGVVNCAGAALMGGSWVWVFGWNV